MITNSMPSTAAASTPSFVERLCTALVCCLIPAILIPIPMVIGMITLSFIKRRSYLTSHLLLLALWQVCYIVLFLLPVLLSLAVHAGKGLYILGTDPLGLLSIWLGCTTIERFFLALFLLILVGNGLLVVWGALTILRGQRLNIPLLSRWLRPLFPA